MTGDINSPPHQQSKDHFDPLSASVSYWFPWKVNITGNAGSSQKRPPTPHSLWFYLTPVTSDPSAGMENGAFVLFNCWYCASRRVVVGWLKTGWETSRPSSVYVDMEGRIHWTCCATFWVIQSAKTYVLITNPPQSFWNQALNATQAHWKHFPEATVQNNYITLLLEHFATLLKWNVQWVHGAKSKFSFIWNIVTVWKWNV